MNWWRAQSSRNQAFIVIGAIVVLGVLFGGGSSSRSIANRQEGFDAATTQPTSIVAAATPSKVAAPAATAAKAWTVVKTWQGNGIKDTEDFTVGEQWRIDWDYSPGPYGGIIQIFVYRSDTKQLVNLVANTQKAGADSSFQRGGGTYYLKVNATDAWKVAIQDFR